MSNLRFCFFFVFVFFYYGITRAEKPPMEFGKVPKEDLEMSVYPLDSSASAVILCNYGFYEPGVENFVHQIRIKILKEEGKRWGDFVSFVREKAQVSGQTVNLENGIPVISKLKKESIFIERVADNYYYRARVAMPNVKVGSVIDIEYFYNGFPIKWYFQEQIPVKRSDLTIRLGGDYHLTKSYFGYFPLSVSTGDHWATEDVPAFKAERYINNPDNYISHFEIDVWPRWFPMTWKAMASVLEQYHGFGDQMNTPTLYLNSLVKQIKSASNSKEQILSNAFQAIKQIKWNKRESILPGNSGLSSAFALKLGNIADINMNLYMLLQKLDISCSLVILSSRDNGSIPPYSVCLEKMNYLIVQAEIDGKKILLDATDENVPVGLLPVRALNGKGFVFKQKTEEWVDLTPIKKEKSTSIFNYKLSADGVLTGEWNLISSDYAAINLRNKIKSFNSQDEYLKSLENDNLGLSIENYTIKDLDSLNKSVRESFTIKLKNRITIVDGKIYIHPIQFDRYMENPFKMEDRVCPVDFTTGKEQVQIVNIEIPEGYEIDQMPNANKFSMPNSLGSCQMQSSFENGIFQLVYKLNINKPVFYQQDYSTLKSFFDQLVKMQNEMLVLKKSTI